MLRAQGSTEGAFFKNALPFILAPSAFFANNGVMVIGQAPSASATVSFSATSGSGVTMTFSAATLLGTASDVGRVLTILDTTYKYATITAQSSTTVATVTLTGTLSGTGPFANNTIWLSASKDGGAAGFSALMPNVYANAYVQVPAGAIAASVPSVATWLFAQFSSTTLATVFNNSYGTGAASIPASPTSFATTGPGAFSQTTSQVSGIQVPIPANTLLSTSALRMTHLYSCPANTNNKTCNLNIAGIANIFNGILNTAAMGSDSLQHTVLNRGAQNVNVIFATSNQTGLGTATPQAVVTAFNFAASQTLVQAGTLANANDYIVMETLIAELIP